MSFPARLGTLVFRIAYPLYYRRRLQREDHVNLLGFSLTVPPGVFHPGLFFSTKILARFLAQTDLKGTAVLEMGCGSGLVSLAAAAGGATVTSVDVNPLAVECTRANAAANGLGEKISVLNSDLFAALPEGNRFDLIVWNPPFYPKEPTDDASRAMNAGEGYSVLGRFAAEAARCLTPGGSILLILTGRGSDEQKIIGFFEAGGMKAHVAGKKRSLFELFRIWRIVPTATTLPP